MIYLNKHGSDEKFVTRSQAVVSVFDSGFILGDGVWEGLRLYNGKWFCLDAHLKRLYQACKFMDIDIGEAYLILVFSIQYLSFNMKDLIFDIGLHSLSLFTQAKAPRSSQGI